MRVGLVLGAGGVQGGAWLTGGLDALAVHDRLGPRHRRRRRRHLGRLGRSRRSASPGSRPGSWSPTPPARPSRASPTPGGARRPRPTAPAALGTGSSGRWPPIGPGSWPLALAIAARAAPASARGRLRGLGTTRASSPPSRIKEIIRSVVPKGWTEHPAHWAVACDYATGRRVAFGAIRLRRSRTSPDAVAASCAVPALYYPVEIGGRRYVDGGIYSTSNLDLLRDEKLDLVICLNPTSSLHPVRALNPREWPNLAFRRASGRRLGSEAKKLRAAGTEVLLIQPTGEDLEVISRNLMSTRNRNGVIATAQRTVAARLESPEVRDLLADLPPGDERRVRRPEGDPSTWPDLDEIRDLTQTAI